MHWPQLIVGAALIAGFCYKIWRRNALRRYSQQTTHWKSVPGKITSATFKQVAGFSDATVPMYVPEVEYAYTVGNVPFTGNRISFSIPTTKFSEKQRIHGLYAVGATIQVFYDPSDPKNAVLEAGVRERRVTFGDILGILAGLFFFAYGLGH